MPADIGTSSPSVIDLQRRIEELSAELRARTAERDEGLQREAATAEVLQIINPSPGDLGPVFDAMIEKAMTLCGANFGLMLTYDGRLLTARSMRNVPEAFQAYWKEPVPVEPGSNISRAFHDRKTVYVPNLVDSEGYRQKVAVFVAGVEKGGVRSCVWVPLLDDRGPVGLFIVFWQDVRSVSSRQIALLESFGAQAVIAMENARLINETREALAQQTATAEVLQVINASPGELAPVFETILAKAHALCRVAYGSLQLYDGERFRAVAVHGLSGPLAGRLAEGYVPGHRLRGLIDDGDFTHIADIAEIDDPMARAAAEGGLRTLLVVALRKDGRLLGQIVSARKEVRPFADSEIALLRSFADQAVIAMENARLLSELRESLDQQTATADILRVIASSPDDVQPVFEAIAERSNKLVDGLSTAVYRLVDDMQHLMSFTPTNPEADAALRALFPAPVSTIFSEAVRIGEIFRIADSEVEFANAPAFRDLARLRGWRSVLMVPLLQDGKAIGLITVTRVEPGLFEGQHVELLKTFADQAVIAISNVGLFQEVQQRTRELSASLEDLRAAQSQLIQSEKLASLGQLAAGIAHEIKNPLNFVNNFAGLSGELLQELKETMDAAIAALSAEVQAEIDEVIDTLSSNLAKIVEHGKRADGIVRGMLEHSRSSTGERRSVDINGLVEEALNLAYHGARAQDQSFSITLKREFGVDIAAIELVPQDMTRVLLNLFGNGFYATRKRQRENSDDSYRPILSVSTHDLGEAVEIRVRDSGTGIAPEVRDKLFQPFFTTKPTGEGTGLGLSISYDIVTQQHGGTITVESEPGQFTEFTVRLPRARRAAAPSGGKS